MKDAKPEKSKKFITIDTYINAFPEDIQLVLQKLRKTIQAAAPLAEETISYQIPTFKLNGPLVHFAAYKKHIGFYPTPSAMEAFKHRLSDYETSRGTIKFPLNEPLPLELIKEMVAFRVKENLEKKQA